MEFQCYNYALQRYACYNAEGALRSGILVIGTVRATVRLNSAVLN